MSHLMRLRQTPTTSTTTMTNRNKSTSTLRLKQDYLRLKRDPVPYITAEPLPSNILEWHYVVKGPEESPYFGGYYHGTLLFPREFPFKPPSIYMLTPNGRFKTNTRLCLSISDFHPDTWNPAWSVGTILTGLLSFMLESTPTLGSTETSIYERKEYARKSGEFNLKNDTFKELFPDMCVEIQEKISQRNSVNSTANGQANRSDTDGTNETSTGYRFNSDAGNTWQSLCSNLIVLAGFAVFALIVNHVIKNLNTD